MEGIKAGTEESPITIKLIAPPLYCMFVTVYHKIAGIEILEKAIQNITNEIKKRAGKHGNCKVEVKPYCTSEEETSIKVSEN